MKNSFQNILHILIHGALSINPHAADIFLFGRTYLYSSVLPRAPFMSVSTKNKTVGHLSLFHVDANSPTPRGKCSLDRTLSLLLSCPLGLHSLSYL